MTEQNEAVKLTVGHAKVSVIGLNKRPNHAQNPKVTVSPASVNLIQPGLANYYRDHVHQMSASVVQRHYVNHEAQMAQFERGKLPLTEADRMEIAESLHILGKRLDEMVPKMGADITDHDKLCGNRASLNWPDHMGIETLKIHLHFCELVDAWNINPYKRDPSTAGVNEYAETNGESQFAFTSVSNRADFIETYNLEDFIIDEVDDSKASGFYYVKLANQHEKNHARGFLATYASAVNALAVLNEEMQRAIRNDGGKIGFVTMDHYLSRQNNELARISLARQELGARYIERR